MVENGSAHFNNHNNNNNEGDSHVVTTTTTNGTYAVGNNTHDAREDKKQPQQPQQKEQQQQQQQQQSLQDVCKDIHDRVDRFLRLDPPADSVDGDVIRRTQKQTRISQGIIRRALLEYGFEHLSISYNGGKDCLILLLLYLSVLWTHFTEKEKGEEQQQQQQQPQTEDRLDQHHKLSLPSSSSFPTTIPSIYAEPPDPFPAVTSFVASSSRAYHLSLTHIRTNPRGQPLPPQQHTYLSQIDGGVGKEEEPVVTFRDAFAQYLDHSPKVQAIFVGTRRTDPHGHNLTFFDMTDGEWPRFMRIHPVLEWRLDEIWSFLRSRELGSFDRHQQQWKGLDYCNMYDQGYTSLGGTSDTLRNPRLKVHEPGGGVSWRPAYQMVDDERERDGRE